MSFGGSVLAMIMSIKDNARLKTNVHEKWKTDKNYRYRKHKSLEFKKVSKEELAVIIAKNRKKAKRERLTQTILTISLFVSILYIGSKFFTNKGENIIEAIQRRKQEQIDAFNRKKELERRKEEEQLLFLLNDGYKWLNKRHYKNAQKQFYKAYEFKPNDFRVKLANATVYVYQCIETQKNCHIAERLLLELKDDFSNKTEVKELVKYYEVK